MEKLTDKLYNWASVIDENTIEQAERTSRLPIVFDHISLMPDAHLGLGSTVGSVIPTLGAVIPAAIGVDIGCGCITTRLNYDANDLPDNLDALLPAIAEAIPAGVGKGHDFHSASAESWVNRNRSATELTDKQITTTLTQFGTLGSGNHFFEMCLDEQDRVWLVLHSGSRGIGNQLAQVHIKGAKQMMKDLEISLEDPDLAYFTQDTPEFNMYIQDMLWAQKYAFASRYQMMIKAIEAIQPFFGPAPEIRDMINCHHNFTEQEYFNGKSLWITRKGAIKADVSDRGVIPGSMGTGTYIVRGKGNALSWNSCSHGAGRKMSRGQARRTFSEADLTTAMGDRAWQSGNAKDLIDEIPGSYKSIETVMADQQDLVTIEHTLRQVLNYKGTR